MLGDGEPMVIGGMTAIESDLMVQDPERILVSLLLTKPRRVVVHARSTGQMDQVCALLHGYQMEKPSFSYGVAITNDMSADEYRKLLPRFDYVQIMGITTIGLQGQTFDSLALDTIASVKSIDSEIPIQIDGGMNIETVPLVHTAGASRAVVGSALWNSADPASTYQELCTRYDSSDDQR